MYSSGYHSYGKSASQCCRFKEYAHAGAKVWVVDQTSHGTAAASWLVLLLLLLKAGAAAELLPRNSGTPS
jgi:hypothetical protein